MSVREARPLRNIGILAHIDAGKTSITERLLYVTGRLRAPGTVDEGTTATDFLAIERERGITVKAAAAHLGWERSGRECRINLIDTPGHVDFSSEVERSLRALDGALVVLCAVAGVQSRTETLYRACRRRGAARIAFVNKMDRRGASFQRTAEDLARMLDPGALPIQLPLGEGDTFRGIIDLVEMKAHEFPTGDRPSAEHGRVAGSSDPLERFGLRPVSIPRELAAESAAARGRLVEFLASEEGETASRLMEDYVRAVDPEPALLREAVRAATLSGRMTPVLCGSAFSDGAAALLLDAVVDYLPAPEEARPPLGVDSSTGLAASREAKAGAPFSAQVFKTSRDPHYGSLAWTRIWSGKVKSADKVLDARADRMVRIVKIFRMQAQALEVVDEAEAGDIVAIALGGARTAQQASSENGEFSTGSTGATLCDPSAPILYEAIRFEEPVVSLAIEPRTGADAASLREAVEALAGEDPSLRFREDPLTGRIELSGMGELHLEVAAERLARERGVRARVGRPRVAYRESLTREASGREDFDRDIGGERVRASVALRLGPAQRGSGLTIAAVGALKAPPPLIEAARRGIEAAVSVGPRAGFPLDDIDALIDELAAPGSPSAGGDRGTERAVEIAASIAAGKAAREAEAVVMEPVMRIDIELADDCLGEAASSLAGRGGRIESVEDMPGGGKHITGAAPLSRLFGFTGELRSATSGRASHTARFLRYEPVPRGFSAWS
ncbi:MAG: elongation factor G [Rectinemataceae bacterium]